MQVRSGWEKPKMDTPRLRLELPRCFSGTGAVLDAGCVDEGGIISTVPRQLPTEIENRERARCPYVNVPVQANQSMQRSIHSCSPPKHCHCVGVGLGLRAIV